jgi:hypothetical protein
MLLSAGFDVLVGAHKLDLFQWAPTLGGECYRFGQTPVSELVNVAEEVSMGTHPWG